MSSNRADPVPSRTGVRSIDHRDVLPAAAGVSPQVLAGTDHGHVLEPTRVVDQDALPLGQDGAVTPLHLPGESI
jgi:hypothetical protein